MTTPNSTANLLSLLGISAASLAVGFGTGRITSPSGLAERPASSPVIVERSEIRTLPAATSANSGVSGAVAKHEPSPDDLKRIFAKTDPGERSRELDAMLANSDLDGVKRILGMIASFPEDPSKSVAIGKLMRRWGELDGASAAAYGIDRYQQAGNSAPLRNALLGWAQTDPVASMQYLQGLGLGRGLSNDFSRDILGVWSNLNPQAAASYLDANPDLQNPWGGGGSGRGGGPWGGVAAVVAANWAAQDPQGAAAWALTLSQGPRQGSVINQVLRQWVAQDPEGAVSFVGSQPTGEVKDGMVSGLARGLAADDPESAMKWVTTIGNQGMQMRAAMGVLAEAGVFTQKGPDMTLAGSLLSGLPAQIRQEIMQRFVNGGGGRPGR